MSIHSSFSIRVPAGRSVRTQESQRRASARKRTNQTARAKALREEAAAKGVSLLKLGHQKALEVGQIMTEGADRLAVLARSFEREYGPYGHRPRYR